MTTQKVGPVELALEIFKEIAENDVKSEKIGSKLRTRAREGPELMRTMGLIPTLSFYYAKAQDALLTSNKEPEPVAYMLYLKAILLYLEKIGIIQNASQVFYLQKEIEELQNKKDASKDGKNKQIEEKRNQLKRNMLSILDNLLNKSSVAKNLLDPYLIEFKRLCEATWEREK
uniref:CRISPR type III-B/RAMP module-associated protein Cmr5 n=1 Tax=Thermofilum adornatum TaxID=1365176 RepID=A0A7C1GKB9_9CREN